MATYALKRILVPIDFSDTSRAALDVASSLAASTGASLHLAHAYQAPNEPLTAGLPLLPSAMLGDIETELRTDLEQLSERSGGASPSIECSVVQGAPSDEIVRLAGRLGVDLIVMGSHGRTGLRHLLLGSVAEHVVRHAPCPVLIVPARVHPPQPAPG